MGIKFSQLLSATSKEERVRLLQEYALQEEIANPHEFYQWLCGFCSSTDENMAQIARLARISLHQNRGYLPKALDEDDFVLLTKSCKNRTALKSVIRCHLHLLNGENQKILKWFENLCKANDPVVKAVARETLEFISKKNLKKTEGEECLGKIDLEMWIALSREEKLSWLDRISSEKDPARTVLLLTFLFCEKDGWVVSRILKIIPVLASNCTKIYLQNILSLIFGFSSHEDPRVRANLLEGLLDIHKHEGITPILFRLFEEMYADGDARVKSLILKGMKLFSHVQGEERLRKLLSRVSSFEELKSYCWLVNDLGMMESFASQIERQRQALFLSGGEKEIDLESSDASVTSTDMKDAAYQRVSPGFVQLWVGVFSGSVLSMICFVFLSFYAFSWIQRIHNLEISSKNQVLEVLRKKNEEGSQKILRLSDPAGYALLEVKKNMQSLNKQGSTTTILELCKKMEIWQTHHAEDSRLEEAKNLLTSLKSLYNKSRETEFVSRFQKLQTLNPEKREEVLELIAALKVLQEEYPEFSQGRDFLKFMENLQP